ncbi:MAG: collagen binding domain-containing protein [Vicinamibacterales bacterium]
MRARVVAVMLTGAAAVGYGQAPQNAPGPGAGTAQLAGRVVDGTTRTPILDAVVSLGGRGGPPQRALVDDDGRFTFTGLPPGVFTLATNHAGYFGNGGAQRDPSPVARIVDLSGGQRVADLTLTLWKLGAIEGVVTADGDPLVGVEVRALRRTLLAGRWLLAGGATTSTDDRGRYRLSGLTPGDYVVVVRPDRDPEMPLLVSLLTLTPTASADVMAAASARGSGVPERDSRVRTYQMAFFRDAASSTSATLVAIDVATDRRGIDAHVRSVKGARVTGRLSGLNGPAESVIVRLIRTDSTLESDPLEAATAACDSDGRFAFLNAPAGKFVVTLLSRPAAPPDPTWWARVPVTIGASDVSGLVVPVHSGVAVNGRVEFVGQAPRPTPGEIAQIAPRLESADAPPVAGVPPWRAVVSADGHFTTTGVPPGRYFVRIANPPRGWTPAAVRIGRRDALDVPLEVSSAAIADVVLTFADRPLGGITGTVTDATGSPASDAVVLIFPAVREPDLDTIGQTRRLRLVHSGTNGAFAVGGLADGHYLAVALPSSPSIDWQDPKRLDALAPHASAIDVQSGPPQSVALTVTVIRK